MAQQLREGMVTPTDIDLQSIIFISNGGQAIDISPIVLELNIYQDIHHHYLQCDLVISDALAFLSSLQGNEEQNIPGGFNGGESLIVSFKTNSDDLDYKTHIFGLYSLTDRKRIGEKNEVYNINGISIEAYMCASKRISRAYGGTRGNLISNMVKSIVEEFMYNRQAKQIYESYKPLTNTVLQKEIYVSPTNGQQTYVVPNTTVDDTIDALALESDCDNHVPLYTFYEDSVGFKFIDFNQLITADPVETYKYTTANIPQEFTDSETNTLDYQKIISYNVGRQTDILFNANRGLFKSRTISVDILRKSKKEYVFDYTKEGEKFSKLQKIQIPGTSDSDGLVYLMQTRIGHDTDSVFEKERPLPRRFNDIAGRRAAFRRQIFNTVMELTVNGNSELNVGDTIDVSIPNATTLDSLDLQEDKYLSGKYIITKLRHKFGGNSAAEFLTFIECTKDTGKDI